VSISKIDSKVVLHEIGACPQLHSHAAGGRLRRMR